MHVIVLGGAGNFGARIVRALRGDPTIDLLVAGRRSIFVPGADDVPCAVIDIGAPDFTQQLRALSPELVIHCVGPFQAQDYRVANAALAARAHYLDLADGRQFIAKFAARVKDQAVRAGRVAISGASTLPALSSAVIEELRLGLSSLESMSAFRLLSDGCEARDMIEKDLSASIAVYRLQAKLFDGRPDGKIQTLTSDCDPIQILTGAGDD